MARCPAGHRARRHATRLPSLPEGRGSGAGGSGGPVPAPEAVAAAVDAAAPTGRAMSLRWLRRWPPTRARSPPARRRPPGGWPPS